MTDTVKRRRPFGAAAFTLITPGLGQLYNGMPRRAALFFAINLAAYLAFNALTSSAAIQSTAAIGLTLAMLIPGLAVYVFMIVDAFRGAQRIGQLELRRYNRWYVYVLVILAATGLRMAMEFTPIYSRSYSLPAWSMAPTLHAGDRIFVAANAYATEAPERGDVVVFELAEGSGAIYVKRLVGLAGDRIQMRNGVLHINGVSSIREFAAESTLYFSPDAEPPKIYSETFPDGRPHFITEFTDTRISDNTQEYRVPPGHIFMMGDNRDNSTDSRFPQIGFIPQENLRGEVMYIYWSRDLSRIGTVVE